MYKVLVVDDEPLIARSIKQMILKANAAFEICDVAYDGASALEKIHREVPDVVFTDIRMPIMDGLVLASRIHEAFPAVHTVILSGYDEFEYAKAAIREGVSAYLLKPLNRDSLAELLARLENELNQACHQEQLLALESILHYEPLPSMSSSAIFPSTQYLSVLLCAGSCRWLAYDFSPDFAALWKTPSLEKYLNEQIPYNPLWIINGYAPSEKLLLIACQLDELSALYKLLEELYRRLDTGELPITMTVEPYTGQPQQAHQYFVGLHQQLSRQQRFGFSTLSLPSAPCPAAQPLDLPPESSRTLAMLFRQSPLENLKAAVDRLLDTLRINRAGQITVELWVRQLLGVLSNEFPLQSVQHETPEQMDRLFSTCCSYEALRPGLQEIIHSLYVIKQQIDYENVPQNQLLVQVRNWLDVHYCEPVTGTELAARFGLVAGYLSRLFKEAQGCSINRYVQELRLKKAEELLHVSPPLPLREIAEATGFSDQFYFSKVFKQTHGVTPAEYRNGEDGRGGQPETEKETAE